MATAISKELLVDYYENQFLTDEQISKKVGVHYNTIRKCRKDYGIDSIGPRERERLLRGGLSPITDRQMSIILGSLLGDSCLKGNSKNSRSFHASHSIKQKDYLEWLYEELESISTKSGISEYIDKLRFIFTNIIVTSVV